MLAALTVIVVVAMSTFVTRVATIALTLTGLSRETARFQARSALTGAGFTTSESEAVVNHPVRRRIIMTLMLIGSAGVVTVIGSTVLTFARVNDLIETVGSAAILVVGLAAIVWAATSKPLDLALQPVITRLLRRYTDIDTRDYARLLHVAGEYSVSELAVEQQDWLADEDLATLRLADEGVLVLGVQRADGETYVGAPKGWTTVHAGDVLILYGHTDRLRDIDERRRGVGESAHAQAVADQLRLQEEERQREELREREQERESEHRDREQQLREQASSGGTDGGAPAGGELGSLPPPPPRGPER